MSNFYKLLNDVLLEEKKSFEDLENDGIIAKRTYYQFKEYTPFLTTILKICNYLNVSLDYLSNRATDNKFNKYNAENINFYQNLTKIIKDLKISQVKFCKDLSIGRANFTYWKQGKIPKLETLILISNYLNCSIDELLF